MMSPSLDADWRWAEALLSTAVQEGGEIALRYWRNAPQRRNKADGSPVSEADLAVDAHLSERLRARLPDAAWLSEETAAPAAEREADLAWIVDPIDGTRPFLAGEPGFCVAAALTFKGRPVASAIYAPALEALFSAARGEGARRNGLAMQASGRQSLEGASLSAPAAAFPEAPPSILLVNTAMCLTLAEVATGAVDALVARGRKSDWDLAAGALLVEEAGGCATRLDGGPFAFNGPGAQQDGVLAAGVHLHRLLRNRFAGQEMNGS